MGKKENSAKVCGRAESKEGGGCFSRSAKTQRQALGRAMARWATLALSTAAILGSGALQAETTTVALSEALFFSGTTPFQTLPGSLTSCGNTPAVPAPGDDCGAKDTYVRTNDQAAFNISVKAEGSLQTNGYLILTMGGTTTPDNYTGPSNASIAVFTAADLPTGQAGCLGITTTAMTEPKAGASGVSADGQTLYCAIAGSDPDNSFNNITAPFIYTVTGSAPNGATITPPSISYTSDQQALPLAFNGASNVTDSNPILTVSAAPRWDVAITAPWVGAIFVAKSGPNEEDGYIFSYNIGVKALGSRVGLEALNSAKGLNFSADFGNSANAASPVKNAQLLTWP